MGFKINGSAEKYITGLGTFVLIIIEYMAFNSPDNLKSNLSNLSQWLELSGIEYIPVLLNNPRAYLWLSRICWIIIIPATAYLVISFMFSSFQKTEVSGGVKHLTELHNEGKSYTYLILTLMSQKNDFLEFKDMPREIKKWRKKVKQALPEKYFYEFENLPKEKDCQGTLRNFLLDFHTHSLEVLAQAAKGK